MKRLICVISLIITSWLAITANDTRLMWQNILIDGQAASVYSMYRDSDGFMWIGCNSGLYGYDGYNCYRAVDDNNDFNAQIYSIKEHDKTLYIGTNNGLLAFDLTSGTHSRVDGDFPSEIRSMLIDGTELWIGSLYGLYIYDLAGRTLRPCNDGLTHTAVYALLHDSHGTIYVGTYDGLCRYDRDSRKFHPVHLRDNATKKTNTFVNAIMESPDRQCLWIGTEGALLRYFPDEQRTEEIEQFSGNSVKSLFIDSDNRLVIGTDNGLYTMHGDRCELYRHDSRDDRTIANNTVWSLYCDSDNNIWAGTEMGFSIAGSESVLRTIKLGKISGRGDGNQIYAILRDNGGNLWLGGTNGVIRCSADDKATWFMPGDNDHPLSHNRVRDIYESSGGDIWVATDGGLNRYDSIADRFINYRITDRTGRFNANWVYAIVENGRKLWTGSYLGGVMAADYASLLATTSTCVADTAYNTTNGLRNNFISRIVSDKDGNIWTLLFRDNALSRIDHATGVITRHEIPEAGNAWPSYLICHSDGNIWCGFTGGVAVITPDGTIAKVVHFPVKQADNSIMTMAQVADGVWVATPHGTWSIDADTYAATLLPLPGRTYTSIYHDRKTDKVLLGTIDEYISVDRPLLSESDTADSIYVMRTVIGAGPDASYISRLNTTEEITVPFDNNYIEIEISTLRYSPHLITRFAFRITDESDEWTLLPDGSNKITLNNLPIGRHKVEVCLIGAPHTARTIDIRILPPWFMTWWALLLYGLILIAAVSALIYYLRRRNAIKIKRLERERILASIDDRLNFLTDISHEFKTPLSMILGPVSKLREDTAADSPIKRPLDTIYDNAIRLNTLVHRTIELNRLESNKDNLMILSRVNMVEFCRSIFETYRDSHPDKHFVFTSPHERIMADVDAVKMESVMNNLLSNACKYSHDQATISGSVTLTATDLIIMVSDDGVGIPEEEHGLIFQRMFRSARTADWKEGTGIGLYLLKQYVEMHHGTIDVHSRENEGTTFIITLPADVPQDISDNTTATVATDNRPRVLIVDDNLAIAGFVKDILTPEYNCELAANGRAGLAVASTFHPHLIIVDEMMPVMTGMEMCRRIKQSPYLSTIPLIMLTAKTDNETETESARTGIDMFIDKPFEAPLLEARVRQLLGARDAMRRSVRIESITTPHAIEAESVSEKQLSQVTQVIESHISDPDLNVNALSDLTGIHSKQLYRLIKKYVGITPVDYIRQTRLRKAAMLLEQHKFTVSEVMYMVGFSSSSYFSKCFQAQYGCKPSQYTENKPKEP